MGKRTYCKHSICQSTCKCGGSTLQVVENPCLSAVDHDIFHFLAENAHPSTMQVRKREGNCETNSLLQMDSQWVGLMFLPGMPCSDHEKSHTSELCTGSSWSLSWSGSSSSKRCPLLEGYIKLYAEYLWIPSQRHAKSFRRVLLGASEDTVPNDPQRPPVHSP